MFITCSRTSKTTQVTTLQVAYPFLRFRDSPIPRFSHEKLEGLSQSQRRTLLSFDVMSLGMRRPDVSLTNLRTHPRLIPSIQKALPLFVGLSISAGCSPLSLETPGPARTPTYSVSSSGLITIPSLRLSFTLRGSFHVEEHPELLFLARSDDPHALISFASDTPAVIAVEPRGNESLAPADIAGVEGVVVTDAHLEGLPLGAKARELLVANGTHSFSAILSAEEQALSNLWEEFVTSIRVAQPLTSELMSRAEGVCSEGKTELADLPPPPESPTVEQRAKGVERMTSVFERLVARLRELAEPGENATYDQWIEDWRDFLQVGPKYAAALRTGDPAVYKRAGNAGDKPAVLTNWFARVNEINTCIF